MYILHSHEQGNFRPLLANVICTQSLGWKTFGTTSVRKAKGLTNGITIRGYREVVSRCVLELSVFVVGFLIGPIFRRAANQTTAKAAVFVVFCFECVWKKASSATFKAALKALNTLKVLQQRSSNFRHSSSQREELARSTKSTIYRNQYRHVSKNRIAHLTPTSAVKYVM